MPAARHGELAKRIDASAASALTSHAHSVAHLIAAGVRPARAQAGPGVARGRTSRVKPHLVRHTDRRKAAVPGAPMTSQQPQHDNSTPIVHSLRNQRAVRFELAGLCKHIALCTASNTGPGPSTHQQP